LNAVLIKYIDFEHSHFAFDSDSRGVNEKYFFFGTLQYTSPLGLILQNDMKLYQSLENEDEQSKFEYWLRKEVKTYYCTSVENVHQMEIITSDLWSLAISYIEIHCKALSQFIHKEIEKFFNTFAHPSIHTTVTFLEKMIAAEKVTKKIQSIIGEKCKMINPELKQNLQALIQLNPFKRWQIAKKVEEVFKNNPVIESTTPLATDPILIDPFNKQKRIEIMEKNFQMKQN